MHRLIFLAAIASLSTGCNPSGNRETKETNDPAPVYEVVLKEQLQGAKKGAGCYLFIDGKDPAPELLERFRKNWPDLQPGSKVPRDRAKSISLDSLKWIDRDTAELQGGTSDGIDGRHSRYRVVRKDGKWIIESAEITAIS